jgi:hypothetical protein
VAFLGAAVAVALGCAEESAAPLDLAGSYALAEALGQPLPATIFDSIIGPQDSTFRLTVRVTGGSLVLAEPGSYRHDLALTVSFDGAPPQTQSWVDHGLYEHAPPSVRFDSDLVQNRTFTAQWRGNELVIMQDVVGEGVPVEFRYRR